MPAKTPKRCPQTTLAQSKSPAIANMPPAKRSSTLAKVKHIYSKSKSDSKANFKRELELKVKS